MDLVDDQYSWFDFSEFDDSLKSKWDNRQGNQIP